MSNIDNMDNPGVKFPPPLVYLILAFSGWGMNKLFPVAITGPEFLGYLGLGIIILSLGFVKYISNIFKKADTEIKPWKTARKIIDYGPYTYSRNPIYVAACGISIGLGLLLDSYWVLLSFIPSLAIVYLIAVEKEEKYLEGKFGQEYINYKLNVRRWL